MDRTKNTLADLNDHLFMQLERLGDEDLTEDQMKQEVDRAKAITQIADKIIDNARLGLEAQEIALKFGVSENVPRILQLEKKEQG